MDIATNYLYNSCYYTNNREARYIRCFYGKFINDSWSKHTLYQDFDDDYNAYDDTKSLVDGYCLKTNDILRMTMSTSSCNSDVNDSYNVKFTNVKDNNNNICNRSLKQEII